MACSPELPACATESCRLGWRLINQPICALPIRFDHPDFAMTIRMENSNNGMSRFFFSYDRGKTWKGPYRLPLFDQKGVMGRTDYIVDGRSRCTLFLTASKSNSREGRPFCATHGRRRPHLAVSLIHRSRARRLRNHAVVREALAARSRHDHPTARSSTELDRRLRVARRRINLDVPGNARA